MPEKTYSARSECGVNTYVDKAIGVGHGPWRPSEAAITAADKKVARDDAETAANAAAKKQVDDIIARGCRETRRPIMLDDALD